MKTTIMIICILLAFTATMVGQNYMGMSRSKIVKNIGEPDRVGENFYVYKDLDENGNNIYYFDEKANCNSFEIVRHISYLNEYKRRLKSEFKKSDENRYIKNAKNKLYIAELTVLADTFQIRIQHSPDISLLAVTE